MWKKEIIDTLKQTALVLSFLLLMPLIFGINQMRFHQENLYFPWYIDCAMGFLIPILVLYLAYMMFASEDSGNALEYLKTLPIRESKLLVMKILPRFAVVFMLVFAYHFLLRCFVPVEQEFCSLILFSGSWSVTHITVLILVGMISGFMLGISERKNPFLAIALAIPVLYIFLSHGWVPFSFQRFMYHAWWRFFQHDRYNNILWFLSLTFQVYLPSVMSLLVLIPVLKSWDVSSVKMRSQRILKRMAAPLVIIICLYTVEQLHLF